jgi:NADPH:quinone reductase-like Zn-dependent oxidoreductase
MAFEKIELTHSRCTARSAARKKQLGLWTIFRFLRERILRSRDLTFHRDLLRATQNRGVDVVLNSVSIPDLFSLLWKSTLLMSALALR